MAQLRRGHGGRVRAQETEASSSRSAAESAGADRRARPPRNGKGYDVSAPAVPPALLLSQQGDCRGQRQPQPLIRRVDAGAG